MLHFAFSSLSWNKTLCVNVLSIIAYNPSSCILEIDCCPWFRFHNYSYNHDICVIRNLFDYRIVWIRFIEQNHVIILYFVFCILYLAYVFQFVFAFWMMNYELWIMNYELWIMNFKRKDHINHEFWKVSLSSNDSYLNEFAHQILSD
jgi:hypothetical protein